MKGDPSTSAFYAIATKAFAREDRGVFIKKAAHKDCGMPGFICAAKSPPVYLSSRPSEPVRRTRLLQANGVSECPIGMAMPEGSPRNNEKS